MIDKKPENREIDLLEVLRVLRRRLPLLAVMTLLGGLAAGLYLLQADPRYVTTSKFILKTDGGRASEVSSLMALAGINRSAAPTSNPSDYIQDIVFDEAFLFKLLDQDWPSREGKVRLERLLGAKQPQGSGETLYAFRKGLAAALVVKKRIVIEKDKLNGLLALSTAFEDPKTAVAVNRKVTDLISEYTLTRFLTEAKERRRFIEERLVGAEKELSQAENALKDFQSRNLNASSPSIQISLGRLLRDLKIREEVYLELNKQLELAKIDEQKTNPMLEIISEPPMPVYPAWPNRNLLLLGGLFLGLLAGTLAAVVLEARRRLL